MNIIQKSNIQWKKKHYKKNKDSYKNHFSELIHYIEKTILFGFTDKTSIHTVIARCKDLNVNLFFKIVESKNAIKLLNFNVPINTHIIRILKTYYNQSNLAISKTFEENIRKINKILKDHKFVKRIDFDYVNNTIGDLNLYYLLGNLNFQHLPNLKIDIQLINTFYQLKYSYSLCEIKDYILYSIIYQIGPYFYSNLENIIKPKLQYKLDYSCSYQFQINNQISKDINSIFQKIKSKYISYLSTNSNHLSEDLRLKLKNVKLNILGTNKEVLNYFDQIINYIKINKKYYPYYDIQYNQISFSLNIMEYPLYQEDWSEKKKLLHVGLILGHEISHCLDDMFDRHLTEEYADLNSITILSLFEDIKKKDIINTYKKIAPIERYDKVMQLSIKSKLFQ